MDKPAVPRLILSFDVDIELEYNSFNGKTAEDIADDIEQELHDFLLEVKPTVDFVNTSLTSCKTHD